MGIGRQESISKRMIDMFTGHFKVVIRTYIVGFMKDMIVTKMLLLILFTNSQMLVIVNCIKYGS